MIRRYCPTDLETLRQITVICFEHVSVDNNIEDHFGIVGGVDWETRKALQIDADAEANPNGIFVAEIEDKVVEGIKDAFGFLENHLTLFCHLKATTTAMT